MKSQLEQDVEHLKVHVAMLKQNVIAIQNALDLMVKAVDLAKGGLQKRNEHNNPKVSK